MKRTKIILAVVATSILLSACARYTDLVQEGKVVLEVIPTQGAVKMTGIRVAEKQAKLQVSELEVTGYVQRVGAGISQGHIDVAILNSDNQILAMGSSRYIPSVSRQRARRRSLFKVQFSEIKQVNYHVRVAFHPQYLSDRASCGNNQAYLR